MIADMKNEYDHPDACGIAAERLRTVFDGLLLTRICYKYDSNAYMVSCCAG